MSIFELMIICKWPNIQKYPIADICIDSGDIKSEEECYDECWWISNSFVHYQIWIVVRIAQVVLAYLASMANFLLFI